MKPQTNAAKKQMKDLSAGKKAKGIKGGGGGAFEIKDFSFGVENPTTIGGTGAAGAGGAGKVTVNEIKIKP
jgi:hypothetical protein